MKINEIAKLVSYLEENLRASTTAGLEFVDTRRHRSRLVSKQNHVVFGRRGAGKTRLVTATKQTGHVDLYLNLEDYKDISFPNIVIRVVLRLFEELLSKVRGEYGPLTLSLTARRVKTDLREVIEDLSGLLHEPDAEVQEVNATTSSSDSAGVGIGGEFLKADVSQNVDSSFSVKRQLPKDKIDHLRIKLPDFKELIQRVSALLSDAPIFLFLDDLYFIVKEIQPDLIDYLHRLTKGTNLFLKIATIKHRSKLYRRSEGRHVGVELGHDVFEVDMDYTLDHFEELQAFMRELLDNAIVKSGANLSVDELFAGEGFPQLCLASGGVPRDFLSLFVGLAGSLRNEADTIGKVAVNEAAIAKITAKFESMKTDSGDDDEILNNLLSKIRSTIYQGHRTNTFLIAKEELETDPYLRQAIRELVDLRLIHLLDENTSKAPSDGRRYEAYILDVGLYENSRPRDFTQIDPGERDDMSRRDSLRASPVFSSTDVSIATAEASGSPPRKTEQRVRNAAKDTDQLKLSFE